MDVACPMKLVALAMKWQSVWPTLQLLELAVKNLFTNAFNTAFTDLTIQSYSCESDKSFFYVKKVTLNITKILIYNSLGVLGLSDKDYEYGILYTQLVGFFLT